MPPAAVRPIDHRAFRGKRGAFETLLTFASVEERAIATAPATAAVIPTKPTANLYIDIPISYRALVQASVLPRRGFPTPVEADSLAQNRNVMLTTRMLAAAINRSSEALKLLKTRDIGTLMVPEHPQ